MRLAHRNRGPWRGATTIVLALAAACAPPANEPSGETARATGPRGPTLRIALFNVRELSAEKLDRVDGRGRGTDEQLRAAAEIVRRIDPDVLVLQEIDLPEDGPLEANAERFRDRYLDLPYPHVFVAPSNTGLLTGIDLDGNGLAATSDQRGAREHGDDSYGFGVYPGQYAMAVLSRVPIDRGSARTFQRFRWKDLPGHHLPTDYYSEEATELLRLSSKSHWDLPLRLRGGDAEHTIHLLVAHPTPPAFDGDEDRNGRRNFDEIGFWAAYLDGEASLMDDQGREGGLEQGASFVVVGDLNARPDEGESLYRGRSGEVTNAIGQLLGREDVQDPGDLHSSGGALAMAGTKPGPPGHKERSTASFLGGSRVDYVLPSRDLEVVDGGVFWPSPDERPDGAEAAERASDHHLVWLDLSLDVP